MSKQLTFRLYRRFMTGWGDSRNLNYSGELLSFSLVYVLMARPIIHIVFFPLGFGMSVHFVEVFSAFFYARNSCENAAIPEWAKKWNIYG